MWLYFECICDLMALAYGMVMCLETNLYIISGSVDTASQMVVAYEINDDKLIMSPQGEESIVWTKSTEQIIVPNAVTLFDGYTSVDSHSWGAVKVVSNR